MNSVAQPIRKDVEELHATAIRLVHVRAEVWRGIAETNRQIQAVEKETKRLKTEFDEITARADVAGFTNAVGVLLRQQRTALPDISALKWQLYDRQTKLSDVHIKRIEYQNERSLISDVETIVDQKLNEIGPAQSDIQRESVASDLRRVLQTHGRYLTAAINDHASYLERLATLDTRQRILLTQTEFQSSYIAERILWVRSAAPITTGTISESSATVSWIINEAHTVWQRVFSDAESHSVIWLLAATAFTILIIQRNHLRVRLREQGQQAARRSTVSLRPTMVALVITIVVGGHWGRKQRIRQRRMRHPLHSKKRPKRCSTATCN